MCKTVSILHWFHIWRPNRYAVRQYFALETFEIDLILFQKKKKNDNKITDTRTGTMRIVSANNAAIFSPSPWEFTLSLLETSTLHYIIRPCMRAISLLLLRLLGTWLWAIQWLGSYFTLIESRMCNRWLGSSALSRNWRKSKVFLWWPSAKKSAIVSAEWICIWCWLSNHNENEGTIKCIFANREMDYIISEEQIFYDDASP